MKWSIMDDIAIKIAGVQKKFGDRWVSRGVNLDIPVGKMTVVLGRSGEGKSVLLKQVIGLLQPTEGSIFINGVDITTAPLVERQQALKLCGYVFQFAALLDSLTVLENVGITLLENGQSLDDIQDLVQEKLRLVNLSTDTLFKYPSELSGGMRKRVGLARTLITDPSIILYDEPTTGLDPITSKIIYELMHSMQLRFNLTSVVVSHDLELLKYADQVALLNGGKIEFVGDARTIWDSQNPYIYQFLRGLPEGPMSS